MQLLLSGSAVTALMGEQTAASSVRVSWREPPAPPSGGYRITTNSGSVNVIAPASPHTLTILQPGVYNIRVESISQHYPGGIVELEEFTLRGGY